VRCKNCQFVYVGNPPLKDAIEKLYTFESGYHNKIIDGLTNYPSIKRAKEQCKFLQEISKPVSLLDAGCSAGFFLNELKKIN
jgi:hypothetical protein